MAKATKKKKVTLSPEWKRFIRAYGADLAYWYWPKGLAVSVESLKPRLAVLKTFEGTEPWRDVQRKYIEQLNKAGVSEAEANWEDGGAPLARMLVQVFRLLGLAWVDNDELIEITKVGNKFLTDADPAAVLSHQMSRYQFWNPSVSSKEHTVIRLHPIPFLAEIIRTLDPGKLTNVEYMLFVARARTMDDVGKVVDQIEAFRGLSRDEQSEIVSQCDAYKLGGLKRGSVYNTIKLARTYAYSAWTLSNLLEKDGGRDLAFAKGEWRNYRKYVDSFAEDSAFIDFKNEKDWIAYFGDPDLMPTKETALEYYVNSGDVAKAVEVKKSQKASKAEVKELKDMLVSEKAVEDYLVDNLDVIGKQLGAELKLIKRQYSTTVGPIDILCQMKKSGEYVVVELKKGRTGDKVYGQCSRYMGWVKKNLAGGKEVHGVIVGKAIDDKLKSARDAHATKVTLIEFQMKFGAKAVT